MSWSDERVGQQFIPPFKINQTALVIFFIFIQKSFTFPYLQKREIHEFITNFPLTAYICHLSKEHEGSFDN